MIKKLILATAVGIFTSIASFAQFSHLGYGRLKLGIQKREVRDMVEMYKVTGRNTATIIYNGLEFDVVFQDYYELSVLQTITAKKDDRYKVKGTDYSVIYYTLNDLENKLNLKLRYAKTDDNGCEVYEFYNDYESTRDKNRKCYFIFSKQGRLKSIQSVLLRVS